MDDYLGSFEENARVRRARRQGEISSMSKQDSEVSVPSTQSGVNIDKNATYQQQNDQFSLSNSSMTGISNLFSSPTVMESGFNFDAFASSGAGIGEISETGVLEGLGEAVGGGGGESAIGTAGGTIGSIVGGVVSGIVGAGIREGFGDRYGFNVFPGNIHDDWRGIGNLMDRIDEDPKGIIENISYGGLLGYGSLMNEDEEQGPIGDVIDSITELGIPGMNFDEWDLGLSNITDMFDVF